MADSTLSTVQYQLKKIIQPYIQDNLLKNSFFYDQIKQETDVEVMNDTFYITLRNSRHSGIVNLANDGALLRSGISTKVQASLGPKLLAGSFRISDLAMKATSTKTQAIESDLKFQARTLMTDMAKDLNRQSFSDGVGVLAQVSGSVGAGTLTVKAPNSSLDDGRSIEWYGTINGDIAPTKYLVAGMAIGIGTAGADVGTITSVAYTAGNATGTIVVTGAPAIAADDAVYRVDGSESAAGTSEIQGFRAAVSTSTSYANLARATVPVWQATVTGTSANSTLALSTMEDAYIASREFASPNDKYVIFMNKTLFRKYADLLVAMRRSVDEVDLTGGFKGIKFQAGDGSIAVKLDYDTPDGEVIGINMDTWKWVQVAEMSWLEDPSNGSILRITGGILSEAAMTWYSNLFCACPAANFRLVRQTAI